LTTGHEYGAMENTKENIKAIPKSFIPRTQNNRESGE
jgi:hypothetical protein